MQDRDDAVIEAVAFQPPPPPGRNAAFRVRARVLLGVALCLLLAGSVWFIFTVKAVRLEVSPAPDRLSIAGGLLQYRLGERYLLRPGVWRLRAEKDGYEPLAEEFTVGRAQDQSLAFVMQRLPGRLEIAVHPATTAEVHVDGVFSGQLAADGRLLLEAVPPGPRQITLTSDRYLRFDAELEVVGMRRLQRLSAELVPAWAEVSLDSVPGEALLLVNGEAFGRTPAAFELLQGRHGVRLQLAGYMDWSRELDLVAGRNLALGAIKLVRAEGSLRLHSSPSGANVTLDGEYMGQSPLTLGLAPGRYALTLSKAGYQPESFSLPVESEQELRIERVLKPLLGVIELAVTPADARLTLNGKPSGRANRRLELPATGQRLEISREGYASWSNEITPTPGFPRRLSVQLSTLEAARLARIPKEVVTSAGQTLKYVAPLDFRMGAGRRTPGRRSNELERRVSLTRAFYLSATEVTNEQLRAFQPGHDSGSLGRALLNRDDRPAVNLDWETAALYCNWLSRQEGLPEAYERTAGRLQLVQPVNTGYRLPTEAEWARAARYATPAPGLFPWGGAMPPPAGSGNYADATAEGISSHRISGYNDGFPGTAPPGSFAANALGLFDLAGNVAEWVHDRYSVALDGEATVLKDPLGPELGDYHVIRGSGYLHGRFSELRWTWRDHGNTGRADVGFRIARYAESLSR